MIRVRRFDEDYLARPACLLGALVAAAVAAWDLVVNFTPSDLVGVVFLGSLGVLAVRSIRRSAPGSRPSNRLWLNLAVVILTMLTVGSGARCDHGVGC